VPSATRTSQKSEIFWQYLFLRVRQLSHNQRDRVLGAQGRRTGEGHPWTAVSVATARRNYRIPGYKRSTSDPSLLSLNAARPRREDLDSKPIRDAIEALRRTGKLPNPETNSRQKKLDLQ
jgi:hypothetical protein